MQLVSLMRPLKLVLQGCPGGSAMITTLTMTCRVGTIIIKDHYASVYASVYFPSFYTVCSRPILYYFC